MLPSGSEGHSWADFIQQERNLNWMSIVGCAGCRALMEKLLKTDRWRTAGVKLGEWAGRQGERRGVHRRIMMRGEGKRESIF